MNKKISLGLSLLASLFGCHSLPTEQHPPSATTDNTAEQAATVYSAILPCSGCDGIRTTLQLMPDNHYKLSLNFLNNTHPPRNMSGLYRMTPDKTFVQLDDKTGNLTFSIGENYLEVRLPDGNKGERPFSDEHYRLQRQ